MKRVGRVLIALSPLILLGVPSLGRPDHKPTAEQAQFFATQVRPILQAHCFSCHGADKKVKGDLRLTSRETLLEGGNSGPVVSLEKPEQSLLVQAINYQDLKMPPKGKLPQAQIDILTRWVKMGVPYVEVAGDAQAMVSHGPPVVDDRARAFWSFRPVVRPPVPAVKHQAWVRNPIDAFVLVKLEEKGLRPAAPAAKVSWLRRAYYSVIGLPPTPAEVDAFLADNSTSAYENAVDRLLDSPRYGEHWGRHWLDLVRYAESNSFERDGAKPFVWRYRDYVIRAFNEDKPYDRFVREQLAGDELDAVTSDAIIATGYYRLGPWDDEAPDRVKAYYDELDDILATTGQTFLGLTVNCARCHDHKIDPFPQQDYYRLLAFFHGIRRYGNGPDSLRVVGSEKDRHQQEQLIAEHNRKLSQAERDIATIEAAIGPHLEGVERDDFQHEVNRLAIIRKHVPKDVARETANRYEVLRRERKALKKAAPSGIAQALCVAEEGRAAKDTFVLLRGNPQSPGDKVEPGFPSILTAPGSPPLKVPQRPKDAASSGRRRLLADWIVAPNNPLTARVMVNRVWQYHFGRGIVHSSSNFGYMGAPPTHPELLDWLASEFVAPSSAGESGAWRLKRLHRLILTSSTFRMSSHVDPAAAARDPENDWLSHFDLRRLTAEEIRDSILAVSGNLYLGKVDGPSVYPLIPAEVLAGQSRPGDGWGKSTPQEAAARSVFIHVKRSLTVPILAAFDVADPDATCPVRFTTTQPTQALGMINSEFVNTQAGIFGDDLGKQAGADVSAQVRLALRRVLQRAPGQSEVDRGVRFIEDTRQKDRLSAGEALRRFCLLALNLNEFVYLD
jgi:mono/diheme cytochrome c family protein